MDRENPLPEEITEANAIYDELDELFDIDIDTEKLKITDTLEILVNQLESYFKKFAVLLDNISDELDSLHEEDEEIEEDNYSDDYEE